MAKAYSDDLRIRVLEAYERGEGSCRVLAARFGVSWEYVRKAVQQQRASGQRERVVQSRFGPASRVTSSVSKRLLELVQAQSDITIAQLRERIAAECKVSMSWTLTQNWTKRLGLRLKKSRSTRSNAIPRSTVSGGPSSTGPS